jgi:hypothetical protein
MDAVISDASRRFPYDLAGKLSLQKARLRRALIMRSA